MDIEGARRVAAARREIKEAKKTEPSESGFEEVSPDLRFRQLFDRIRFMDGGMKRGQDEEYWTLRGLSTEIVAEDGSKLGLTLDTVWHHSQGAGNGLTVRAQWKGDGRNIKNVHMSVPDRSALPDIAEDADKNTLRVLAELEEAASAAEFMIEASRLVEEQAA